MAYIAIIMTVLLMIMILSQIQTRGQEEYQKKMSLTPLLGEITAELDMKAKNVETLTQRFHASNQSTLRLVEMFMESGAFKELAAATDMITAATFKFIRLWDRYADEHGIRVRDRFDLNNALPFFQYNYFIRPLLKTVYAAGLEEAIHESFARIMVPPERTEDAAAAYRVTFYAHGLYGLLDGWIRGDFRETPEEMAQMLRDIIQGQ